MPRHHNSHSTTDELPFDGDPEARSKLKDKDKKPPGVCVVLK